MTELLRLIKESAKAGAYRRRGVMTSIVDLVDATRSSELVERLGVSPGRWRFVPHKAHTSCRGQRFHRHAGGRVYQVLTTCAPTGWCSAPRRG